MPQFHPIKCEQLHLANCVIRLSRCGVMVGKLMANHIRSCTHHKYIKEEDPIVANQVILYRSIPTALYNVFNTYKKCTNVHYLQLLYYTQYTNRRGNWNKNINLFHSKAWNGTKCWLYIGQSVTSCTALPIFIHNLLWILHSEKFKLFPKHKYL